MHLKMSSGKWRPFCLGLNVVLMIPNAVSLHIQHSNAPRVLSCDIALSWVHTFFAVRLNLVQLICLVGFDKVNLCLFPWSLNKIKGWSAFAMQWHLIRRIGVRLFPIYDWALSRPMSEDVTHITSSLTDWGLAQPQIENGCRIAGTSKHMTCCINLDTNNAPFRTEMCTLYDMEVFYIFLVARRKYDTENKHDTCTKPVHFTIH